MRSTGAPEARREEGPARLSAGAPGAREGALPLHRKTLAPRKRAGRARSVELVLLQLISQSVTRNNMRPQLLPGVRLAVRPAPIALLRAARRWTRGAPPPDEGRPALRRFSRRLRPAPPPYPKRRGRE